MLHLLVSAVAFVQSAPMPYSPAEIIWVLAWNSIWLWHLHTAGFGLKTSATLQLLMGETDFFILAFISYAMTPKFATGILHKQPIQQVCAEFGTWLIIILYGWVNQDCTVQERAVWKVAFIYNIHQYFTLLSHALCSLQQMGETVLTHLRLIFPRV